MSLTLKLLRQRTPALQLLGNWEMLNPPKHPPPHLSDLPNIQIWPWRWYNARHVNTLPSSTWAISDTCVKLSVLTRRNFLASACETEKVKISEIQGSIRPSALTLSNHYELVNKQLMKKKVIILDIEYFFKHYYCGPVQHKRIKVV